MRILSAAVRDICCECAEPLSVVSWHPDRIIRLCGVAKRAPTCRGETGDPSSHKGVQTVVSAPPHSLFQPAIQLGWLPAGASRDRTQLILVTLLGPLMSTRWQKCSNNCEWVNFDGLAVEAST